MMGAALALLLLTSSHGRADHPRPFYAAPPDCDFAASDPIPPHPDLRLDIGAERREVRLVNVGTTDLICVLDPLGSVALAPGAACTWQSEGVRIGAARCRSSGGMGTGALLIRSSG